MKILLSFIVFLASLAAIATLLFGSLFLRMGQSNILESSSIVPDRGSLRTLPVRNVRESVNAQEKDGGKREDRTVIYFTWRGDEIMYDEKIITEDEFVEMLNEAKEGEAQVEIVKFDDVQVGVAHRWRQLLREAEVSYKITPNK